MTLVVFFGHMDNGWVCLSDYSCVSILVVLCVYIYRAARNGYIIIFVQPVTAIFLFLKMLGVVAKNALFFNPTVKFC